MFSWYTGFQKGKSDNRVAIRGSFSLLSYDVFEKADADIQSSRLPKVREQTACFILRVLSPRYCKRA